MKTVRYISFIPAFFISLFIAKILVKLIIYLISFLNQFRGIEPDFLWIDFIVHVFSVFIAISASIEIYPNQNKKIPILWGFIVEVTMHCPSCPYKLKITTHSQVYKFFLKFKNINF